MWVFFGNKGVQHVQGTIEIFFFFFFLHFDDQAQGKWAKFAQAVILISTIV